MKCYRDRKNKAGKNALDRGYKGIGAYTLFSNTILHSLTYRKTGKFASKLVPKRIRQYVNLHLIRNVNHYVDHDLDSKPRW